MFLLKDIKVSASLCGALFLLAACSSASFPEIEENTYDVSSAEGGVLKENSGLLSDNKNVAYDDEETVDTITPAKTTPIIIADSEDLDKEETLLGDEDVDFFGVPFDEDPDTSAKTAKTAKAIKPAAVSKPVKRKEAAAKLEANQPALPSVTYLAETFYFNNGSSALENGVNTKIRQIVREAKRNNAFIRVMGYSSSRTRNTDLASHKMANFKISLARAEAVAAALRRAGMPAGKILVEAMSDNRPAYLEVMPEGERLNRRAEVYISY